MPKRTDIKSILIIGAGPIVIGQACEFDYSGTQACKALKAEGYRIVLVNSNPATIMTDPELADATYVEPITPEVVAKIIERERPDALLPTMGGQTALNTALSLARQGVLAKFGVEMIGAKAEAIDKAEDRKLFREAMTRIGLATPEVDAGQRFRAQAPGPRPACRRAGADRRARRTGAGEGAPARGLSQAVEGRRAQPPQALPGAGAAQGHGGPGARRAAGDHPALLHARRHRRRRRLQPRGVRRHRRARARCLADHQVLVEESVLGWKEFEMEVVRDRADNCIIVCSIENVDPMGVHTGDSITVAPALTLTDKEYQIMRNASIAVLREIGVETGGSNVQFAVNPADGRLVIIEMNPRVSRSSALASKATGFPIAKVAAKLAVGYTLDELENDITGGATPASFEPTIDYVVTKIPRFAFEKFPGAERTLTTSMKSVGEVMAIGRTFAESLQKALRGLESGLTGLDDLALEGLGQGDDKNVIRAALGQPTPDRILKVAQAMRLGVDHEQIHASCRIDPWFLARIQEIVDMEARVRAHGLPASAEQLRGLKAMGFSDARLAKLAGLGEAEVRKRRIGLGVRPVFKRIDTCAAEFASPTAYMYSTYERGLTAQPVCEADPSTRDKVDHPGRRPQPHRPGHRVRLLLLPCRLRAVEGRHRDHHDQLQPRDGLDRLRHLRPALLRAAHRRGRAGDHPGRAVEGATAGRHRAVRRADAAQAGARARGGGRADPRHLARCHRPRRGPRPLQGAGRPAAAQAARERHRPHPRRGAQRRRQARLSRGDPPVLRAGRPSHGDRRRRRRRSTATWRGCRPPSTSPPSSSSPKSARC